MMRPFEELIAEAEQAHFSGWDFSFLRDRLTQAPLSWNYAQLLRNRFTTARAMLDLDTGGGEKLATLAPLPRLTVASESHPPNVPIAAARLAKSGVHIVQVDPNVNNQHGPRREFDGLHPERALPLADESFDLIACRHGSFSAKEVARLLRPGGELVAQLVGDDNYPDLNKQLEGPPTHWRKPGDPEPPALEAMGLEVLDRRQQKPAAVFTDIGAVVYYLKAVPWQLTDFSIADYLPKLRKLDHRIRRHNGLQTHYHSQLIIARKRS